MGFSASAVKRWRTKMGTLWGRWTKRRLAHSAFIMALGLFWDIVTGLPWTPNGVGSLEPRGFCIFLPGAHYLTIYNPYGADSSLKILLLLLLKSLAAGAWTHTDPVGELTSVAAWFWGKVGKERWKRWGFSAGRGRRKMVHIWGLGAGWAGEGWGREEGRIWDLSTGGALQVWMDLGLGGEQGADLGGLLVKFKTRHWVHFPDSFKRWRVRRRSTQSSVMKATEGARHLCGPPWHLKNQIWPAVKKGWEPLL